MNWRTDIENKIASGAIHIKEARAVVHTNPPPVGPRPTNRPSRTSKMPERPAAVSIPEDAMQKLREAEQAVDFATTTPKPGSAAAGICSRGKTKQPGEMNQTEAAFAEILEARKRGGEILDYRFEELTLKTGVRAWYRPDFYVILGDGRMYLVEVKAFRDDKETGEMVRIVNEDSTQKIKACLLRHPYPIRMAFGRVRLKRDGGGHEFREEWAGGVEP